MASDPQYSRARQLVGILLVRDSPFWRGSRARRIARFVLLVCYLYIGALLVLLVLEDRFLFPGATVARSWLEPPDYLGIREVTFDSADGDRIYAWFSAPEGWEPRHGAVL